METRTVFGYQWEKMMMRRRQKFLITLQNDTMKIVYMYHDDDEPYYPVCFIATWQIHWSPSNHLQSQSSPNEKWSNDWDISIRPIAQWRKIVFFKKHPKFESSDTFYFSGKKMLLKIQFHFLFLHEINQARKKSIINLKIM